MPRVSPWVVAITAATPIAAEAAASPAARPAAPAPPAPGAGSSNPPTVRGVTVTVDQQAARLGIDRRSYSVAQDLQTTNGAITDALRNIPSVQVDVEGNVSLRGDANVTILVDGKPSALFRGEGRGAALEQLPADQIERVEVITNPSAAFSPEGSAGIINLITRSTFRPGYSGTARANVGTGDRRNGGVNAAYQDGKLTLSGSVSGRRDPFVVTSESDRIRLGPAQQPASVTRDRTEIHSVSEILSSRLGADYDVDPSTRVGGELSYQRVISGQQISARQEQESAGQLVRGLYRFTDYDAARETGQGGLNFRRKFSGDQHELTGSLRYETTNLGQDRRVVNLGRFPAAPDELELYNNDHRLHQTTVRVDYNRPLPDEARLKVGYALDATDNSYVGLGRRGPAAGVQTVDPLLALTFDYKQTVHAAYVTYQRAFGDLTVLPGVRVEAADVAVQPAGGAEQGNDYLNLYPSLHLSYRLAEGQQLTGSFSMRVTRPRPEQLYPGRVYQDPFTFREGNPQLAPQQTRSYELGYQYRKNATFYLATAYFRESTGGITELIRDLGGGVFLTKPENLRNSRSGGLELVANSRFSRKLTYNVSGSVAWNEIEAATPGFAARRSAYVLAGRANLNWQATPRDFVQLNGFLIGKTLNAQGYTSPFGILNLGYRHKLTDKLTLMIQGQDLLKTARQRIVYDTPLLSGFFRQRVNQRAVFVGLTWTFGTSRQPQRDPGFDFEGGGAGAAPTP